MFELLAHISAFLAFLSGAIALCVGNWNRLALKHSALFLSTISCGVMFLMVFLNADAMACLATQTMCANWQLYACARNFCFILFHIAVGRDALQYKKWDRRNIHSRWGASLGGRRPANH